MDRYLKNQILADVNKKIILLTGPRQVGKTTVSKTVLKSFEYYNYDLKTDRKLIQQDSINFNNDHVILDELHKMKKWKSWLKGHFDTRKNKNCIIVTGSAKIDTYKKMGDSMAGRYFEYRLMPLDVKELVEINKMSAEQALSQLLVLSGFPEPFLSNEERVYKKWRNTHLDIILKLDIPSLENIKSMDSVELLITMMTERVGSLISYNSLREDLNTDDKSVKRWFLALENSYVLFKVLPYSKKINRSISKSPKYYFFDIPRVTDPGARFENLVALSIYKEILYRKDSFGDDYSMHFLRNRNQNEVDFLICKDKNPILMIECKISESNLNTSFSVFEKQLFLNNTAPQKIILVQKLARNFTLKDGTKVIKASDWLSKMSF